MENDSTIDKLNLTKTDRRNFLKKTIYSTPVLIAMGQLVKPAALHGDSCLDGDPDNTCSEGW